MIALLVLAAALADETQLPSFADHVRFESFAVTPEVVASPHPPILASREARLYRTQLRREGALPPNFAGHHRVAIWGCGTCCRHFGIIDSKTGDVWMSPFSVACGAPMELPANGHAGLYFRPDSALFVVIGSRNEGPKSGIYYFKWNGRTLELLRTEAEIASE